LPVALVIHDISRQAFRKLVVAVACVPFCRHAGVIEGKTSAAASIASVMSVSTCSAVRHQAA